MNKNNISKSSENPLAGNFHLSALLKFALPTIIMMLFMGLYTLGDTIFVSRFVSTDGLSAVNIVCPVINIIVGLAAMAATGGNAVIGRKMGAGQESSARQNFTLLILFASSAGILITIMGILFLNQIIWALGASEVLFPYCRDYLFVLLLFTPASILQVLFQNLIVTAGRPGFGMVLSMSAGAVNVLLDYVFMVPLHMGIVGSALGTGIGYLIPTIIGILFFMKPKGSLYFQKPVADMKFLGETCYNGVSELVSQIAAGVTTFLFNWVMMKLLGEKGVAAVTIMIYAQFMLTALYIGFSMGVAPIISYNYGSKNRHRLKVIFKNCLLFIGVVSVLTFALSMTFSSPLVAAFTPKGSEVYEIAYNGFLIFPFSFLFCGMNIFSSAAFTALSNGKVSATISFLRTFGFITAGLLILPYYFGVKGVWLSVPMAELITMILSILFLLKYRKRYL